MIQEGDRLQLVHAYMYSYPYKVPSPERCVALAAEMNQVIAVCV